MITFLIKTVELPNFGHQTVPDIIKTATSFIKTTFKTQKKIKELETMY